MLAAITSAEWVGLRSYGYKQLIYEPFLGGGALTALSIPIILQVGSAWFGVMSLGATVVLTAWGIQRGRAPATAGDG